MSDMSGMYCEHDAKNRNKVKNFFIMSPQSFNVFLYYNDLLSLCQF